MRIRTVIKEYEVMLVPIPTAPAAGPSARGKGEWKVYGDGSRQCKASVTNLNLPDGSKLDLAVSGRAVGEMLVERKTARFRRESEKGEFVPVVQRDELLQVMFEGKVILEGRFYIE